MQAAELKSSMLSRLGKACNDKTLLIDRAQHVLSSRNLKPDLREKGLTARAEKKQQGQGKVDVKSFLNYHQSLEQERQEAAERQRRAEAWKLQELKAPGDTV